MNRSPRTFLVVVDGSEELPVALRYAARRARDVAGRVALLSIVEPEGIETWGGVERALTDEAFDRARQDMAQHIKQVEELTGGEPLTFFRKGQRREVLLELLEKQPEISVLVLAAQTRDGGSNPLIKYLTSEKGLRRLKVPLIIVPETYRETEGAES